MSTFSDAYKYLTAYSRPRINCLSELIVSFALGRNTLVIIDINMKHCSNTSLLSNLYSMFDWRH